MQGPAGKGTGQSGHWLSDEIQTSSLTFYRNLNTGLYILFLAFLSHVVVDFKTLQAVHQNSSIRTDDVIFLQISLAVTTQYVDIHSLIVGSSDSDASGISEPSHQIYVPWELKSLPHDNSPLFTDGKWRICSMQHCWHEYIMDKLVIHAHARADNVIDKPIKSRVVFFLPIKTHSYCF